MTELEQAVKDSYEDLAEGLESLGRLMTADHGDLQRADRVLGVIILGLAAVDRARLLKAVERLLDRIDELEAGQ